VTSDAARWDRAVTLGGLVAALAAWEWVARAGVISSVLFPPPSQIAASGWRLTSSGELVTDIVMTVRRVMAGVVLGGGPGWALGLLMGWSRRLRRAVDPIVAALHPVPKVALFPLLLIVFGLGETPRILAIALSTFFPTLISTLAGVRQIDRVYFEVARNYDMPPLRVFTHVVVPGSLPQALAGLRLGLNTALLVAIAVELLSAREGLGALMWRARETLRLEELYLGLLAASLLGVLFHGSVRMLGRRLVRWREID